MQHIAHRDEGGVVLDAVVLHTTSRSLKQVDQFRGDFLGLVLVVLLEHIEGVLVVVALVWKSPYVRVLVLDVVESLLQHRFGDGRHGERENGGHEEAVHDDELWQRDHEHVLRAASKHARDPRNTQCQ